jgi:hypothetical protein
MEPDDHSSSCHHFHGNDIDTVITEALSNDRCTSCSPPMCIPDQDCVICMEKMEITDQISHLPVCHHSFHQECITKWFITKINAGQIGRCPICNLGIVWALQVQPEPTPTTFIEYGNRNNRRLTRCISCAFFIFLLFVAIATILKCDQVL